MLLDAALSPRQNWPVLATFILAVATSTVCATLLNQAIVQWREYAGRREVARLSALYAANALERYCELCSQYLGQNEDFISSDGHAGSDLSGLPDLAEYPAEIDWKRLGLRYTDELFAFRTALAQAQNLISAYYEFDPPDGGDHHVLEQLSLKGMETARIARDMRAAFGLRQAVPGGEYSSERHLIESHQRRQEKHRLYLESQERSRELLNQAVAPSPEPDELA